jgi:hypothetical protein
MKVITFLAATVGYCAFAVQAQQVTDTPHAEQQRTSAANQTQGYSEAESIAHDLSIDLLALNDPGALDGLAVIDTEGHEIGMVSEIARSNRDQSLQAIIRLASGASAALALDEMTLAAFAYYDPAQSLSAQPFAAANFEQISEYQAGHSAWGSLRTPVEEYTARNGEENSLAEATAPVRKAAVTQQAQADSAQLQTPAGDSVSGSAAATAYTASGSPIVQMALTSPDAMQGIALVDEAGHPLGVLAHVARNLADQALYAVIDMNGEKVRTAVKLDALSIGKLAYTGDTRELHGRNFVDDDFVPLVGQ